MGISVGELVLWVVQVMVVDTSATRTTTLNGIPEVHDITCLGHMFQHQQLYILVKSP